MTLQANEALLLRAVDYADADRIVTLLTRSDGKASFIARGARRSKRRFGGALEPFALLGVELRPGRGPLGVLAQAQVTRSFPRVLGDLSRMAAGFAALELLRELSAEHQPDPAIFDLALGLLEALEAAGAAPEPLLVCFGLRLLALLGFAPQLLRCGSCGREPEPGQAAEFDAQEGYLVCRLCGGAAHHLSGEVRGRMLAALEPGWLGVAQAHWPRALLQAAYRAFLAFTEHRLGRPLQAAALLQREPRPAP